jgi:hypothetical protein
MAFARCNGIRPMQWHSPDAMAFAPCNGIRQKQWHSSETMAFVRNNGIRPIFDREDCPHRSVYCYSEESVDDADDQIGLVETHLSLKT